MTEAAVTRAKARAPRLFGLAVSSALAFSSVGCPSRGLPDRVQMPQISGVVVDVETGEPVGGAEVFIHWGIELNDLYGHGRTKSVDAHWATTNGSGQFVVPRHEFVVPEGMREDGILVGPNMQIISRSHYEPIVFADWIWDGKETFDEDHPEVWARPRDGVVRAARTLPHYAEAMENKRRWGEVCGSVSTSGANAHCCEVIFGDPDFCCKQVYGTRGSECGRPEGSPE